MTPQIKHAQEITEFIDIQYLPYDSKHTYLDTYWNINYNGSKEKYKTDNIKKIVHQIIHSLTNILKVPDVSLTLWLFLTKYVIQAWLLT